MGIKKFKPTTPSNRYRTVSTFEEITKDKPERSLVQILTKSGGRNNKGRVTSSDPGAGGRQDRCRHRRVNVFAGLLH